MPERATLKDGELVRFSQERQWQKLPKSQGMWSAKYLTPKMRDVFGVRTIPEFYAAGFASLGRHEVHLLALGSGLAVVEEEVVAKLAARGVRATVDCLEMSPERVAQATARLSGTTLRMIQCDMLEWRPERQYDGVIANHSLHHFLELEQIFQMVSDCLAGDGLLITNDMIGRNGHQRWPEARKYIDSFWSIMPDRYKFNHPFNRQDATLFDRNQAERTFEGIRAQDILPLLIERFHPVRFVAEGGIIDPFTDRVYGHNFLPDNAEDAGWIDRIGFLNDILIDVGEISPTMMLAWFSKKNAAAVGEVAYRHWTAEFCVKRP